MAGAEATERWCVEQFKEFLNLSETEGDYVKDIAGYIVPMDSAERGAYVRQFLGSKPEVEEFIAELDKRTRGVNVVTKEDRGDAPSGVTVYRKGMDDEPEITRRQRKANEVNTAGSNEAPSKSKKKKAKTQNNDDGSMKTKKKKKKRGGDNQPRVCNCQALEHDLVGNCLACGRIVCKEEARTLTGNCSFCGQDLANMSIHHDEKAEQMKDKLIEFDRTGMSRTKVYDDQSDYFATQGDGWLSKEEREMLKEAEMEAIKKKEEDKRRVRIDFDLAGRCVVVQGGAAPQDKTDTHQTSSSEWSSQSSSQSVSSSSCGPEVGGMYTNPYLSVPAPVFVAESDNGKRKGGRAEASEKKGNGRCVAAEGTKKAVVGAAPASAKRKGR
eukprot:TRINITY_DN5516_c2_g1_i2.p1 TRINITY_DN5516_c2_g1~~TRINITY_DN5516_c2_g1_i2.p1  ORF type:complete len:383 (-),score=118.14 TRINITY_DN5516_c2_g1_i2:210-1358(-)